jgi:hypothetical protein
MAITCTSAWSASLPPLIVPLVRAARPARAELVRSSADSSDVSPEHYRR